MQACCHWILIVTNAPVLVIAVLNCAVHALDLPKSCRQCLEAGGLLEVFMAKCFGCNL